MARMTDFEREAWAAVLGVERAAADAITRHHGASQAPAGPPVTVDAALAAAPAKETHMSALSDRIHAIAAEVEPYADEDLGKLAAIVANPAAKEAFDVLHAVTGIGVDPAIVSLAIGGLKALVQAYAPAQAAAAA